MIDIKFLGEQADIEALVRDMAKKLFGADIAIPEDPGPLIIDTVRLDLLIAPKTCLLYTSPSPRDGLLSRMPSSA